MSLTPFGRFGEGRRVVYVWEATREVVVPSSRNGRKGSNPDRDRTRATKPALKDRRAGKVQEEDEPNEEG